MRIPNQAGHIDLNDLIFNLKTTKGRLSAINGPCQGMPYTGPGDLPSLIHNSIDGPAFCSSSRSMATVAFAGSFGSSSCW